MKHEQLTERVIAAFYQVYNTLGWGFLEKVYHNALLHELGKRGLRVETKVKFDVYYDGIHVGEYFADIVVEGLVILELKAVETLAPEHEAQLVNYLKASSVDVGLLLNFGPKPVFRRKVYETARLKSTSPLPTAMPNDHLDDPADHLFQ
jgi:GxxExxY protein